MLVVREGLRCPIELAESPREEEIQLMSELGEDRIRLLSSSWDVLERGEMEIGRLCPSFCPEPAVSGLMMPEPSGDGYSSPSSSAELGMFVSSWEMEVGVLDRLGKSGEANGIERPPDGPTPHPLLRERAWTPSPESCDLLSPLAARVLLASAEGEVDTLFLPLAEPPPSLLRLAPGGVVSSATFGVSAAFSMTPASELTPFASVELCLCFLRGIPAAKKKLVTSQNNTDLQKEGGAG